MEVPAIPNCPEFMLEILPQCLEILVREKEAWVIYKTLESF